MKKYTAFGVCCLAALFAAAAAGAQQGGFTGPAGGAPFTGPSRTVTVAQAGAFPHKAPVILTGSIVQAVGGDYYTFRDASGEMPVKIKMNRWWGVSAGPSDRVEISGELKRDKRNRMWYYIDVKYIRRV